MDLRYSLLYACIYLYMTYLNMTIVTFTQVSFISLESIRHAVGEGISLYWTVALKYIRPCWLFIDILPI